MKEQQERQQGGGGEKTSTSRTNFSPKSRTRKITSRQQESQEQLGRTVRGTDVNTVKGHSGADFEGYCTMNRRTDVSLLWCSCLFRKIDEIGVSTVIIFLGQKAGWGVLACPLFRSSYISCFMIAAPNEATTRTCCAHTLASICTGCCCYCHSSSSFHLLHSETTPSSRNITTF